VANGRTKKIAYSRIAVVESVNRFLDINDGNYYYQIRLRRFSIKDTVGIQVDIVTRERIFRKGQFIKVTVERRGE